MKSKRFTIDRFYVAILVLMLLLLVSRAFSQPLAYSWQQVPSPNPAPIRSMLRGIDGTSSTDIWAVGDIQTSPSGLVQYTQSNLLLHWNGSAWTRFTPQEFGQTMNSVWDVEAISPTNVWAVGDYDAGGGASQSQILHWDGSSWTNQGINLSTGTSFLWSVDALSASDVWAVGGKAGVLYNPTFAYHYDGSSWTDIPTPQVGLRRQRFTAVDGIAANDVWAVGSYGDAPGQFKYLTMHWDGSAWTNFPVPGGPINGELLNVHMVSSNDVWAVGDLLGGGMMMLHWDGTSWSQVTTHGGGGAFAALAPNDVYAVGAEISHWDGSSWSVVDSLRHLPYPALGAATVLPNGEIWAAGRTIDNNNIFRTLVYQYGPGAKPLDVTASDSTIAAGGTSQLNARLTLPGNYTYSWSPGSSLNDSTLASPVASPGTTTRYTLNVTDANGYSVQGVFTLKVAGVLSATAPEALRPEVQAYPNPFADELRVRITAAQVQTAQFTLTDALGRPVSRQQVRLSSGENQVPLNLGTTAPGLYLLTIRTAAQLHQLKLIRE